MQKPSYKLISSVVAGCIIINLSLGFLLIPSDPMFPVAIVALINLLWLLEISVSSFLLGKRKKGVMRGILYILLFLVITVIVNTIIGLLFSMPTMQSVYGVIAGVMISSGFILWVILTKLYRVRPIELNDTQSKTA